MRRRRIFRVRGASMEPTLIHGDYVLIDPTATVVVGAIVVCRHPFRNLDVIKSVASIDDGLLTLHSESGTDSRQFGRAPLASVKGVATVNLRRRRRLQPTSAAIASSGSTNS